jgi:oxygen-independent coproporphyrinogen-3 oxidase
VYVHVPFCAKRCDYCAFATWTDKSDLMDTYVDAMVHELVGARDDMPVATSVFFGGGTPSLLPADDLVRVLAAIERTADAEVTVECNPDTITPELLDSYVAGGVNRLSFGVQSMVPHVLAGLGRTHTPANVERAVALVRERPFRSFNLDLIYGGAGESLDDWQATLDAVAELDPPHISAYALTVEGGTPLADDPGRHPDEDDQADKYQRATEHFAAAGLVWYEISNWAKPGHGCRHNRLYWNQGEYLGVGCAAHSHRRGRRWWNVRTPERYLERLDEGRSPESAFEQLDEPERELEALQLALRTDVGVPTAALAAALAEPDSGLDRLVERRGDRVVLSVAGRLLANQVALRLVVPASSSGGRRNV